MLGLLRVINVGMLELLRVINVGMLGLLRVINVGMLGLLRRLHRLQIQFKLEAESVENGIKYPHCEKHKNKDGSNKQVVFSLDCASDTAIAEAV